MMTDNVSGVVAGMSHSDFVDESDEQRRFGGLQRLYGPLAIQQARAAHVAVAGIGGVGSWAAEALVRSGVGAVSLIDLDHIAESNINRQIHALGATVGQSKIEAMALRLQDINPACRLNLIDDFVSPDNVMNVLAEDVGFVLDCTDQPRAKIALILEARRRGIPVVVCGGAGGKINSLTLQCTDIAHASNDALLASVRNALRRLHGYPRGVDSNGRVLRPAPRMGVRVLWFNQPALLPEQWTSSGDVPDGAIQGLSCAGYGSVVTVTATMGMAAAGQALDHIFAAGS